MKTIIKKPVIARYVENVIWKNEEFLLNPNSLDL